MDITATRAIRGPEWEMENEHFHIGKNELYYLCSGTTKMFVGSSLYTLHEGDCIYIPAGCLHRTSADSQSTVERMVVMFPEGKFEMDNEIMTETILRAEHTEDIKKIFQRIIEEKRNQRKYSEEMINALVTMLMIELIRIPHKSAYSEEMQPETAQIQRTAQYISMHPEEKITLQSAADFAGFARTYFSQKFKNVTGFNFNDYLTAVRIKKGAALLKKTSMSITEIAFECGYNDSNYFASVFKKHFGMTPNKYRKYEP